MLHKNMVGMKSSSTFFLRKCGVMEEIVAYLHGKKDQKRASFYLSFHDSQPRALHPWPPMPRAPVASIEGHPLPKWLRDLRSTATIAISRKALPWYQKTRRRKQTTMMSIHHNHYGFSVVKKNSLPCWYHCNFFAKSRNESDSKAIRYFAELTDKSEADRYQCEFVCRVIPLDADDTTSSCYYCKHILRLFNCFCLGLNSSVFH